MRRGAPRRIGLRELPSARRAGPASPPWPARSGRPSSSSSRASPPSPRPAPRPSGSPRRDASSSARSRGHGSRAAVVRASLATTHRNIGTLLRHLYVNGEAEPLAVLFGARSLDAVLEGIDGLERATALNRRLASEARATGDRLAAELTQLSRADVELDAVEARARAAAAAHVAAVGAKRRTLRRSAANRASRAPGSPRRERVRPSARRRGSRGQRAVRRHRSRRLPSCRRSVRRTRARRHPVAGSSSRTRSPTTFPGGRRAACRSGSG